MTIVAWLVFIGLAMIGVIAAFLDTARREKLKRKAAAKYLAGVAMTRQLEADVARPLSELIAEAEEKVILESQLSVKADRDERGLRMTHSRHAEFSDCIDCGKEAIYTKGLREPVAWVLTDPCPLHR